MVCLYAWRDDCLYLWRDVGMFVSVEGCLFIESCQFVCIRGTQTSVSCSSVICDISTFHVKS